MTYLQIQRLSLKNIRCFNTLHLDFNKGTNVITGENGAGKSTILISIGFALFGNKYLVNTDLEQNNLIKWGETDGSIELEFLTSNGSFTSLYELTNRSSSWVVTDNNTGKILSTTIGESRNSIQNLLGNMVDANIFKNALCSGQGELTSLLDARPAERKLQLNKILGLTEYSTTSKHMSKIIKKLNTRKSNLANELKYLSENHEDSSTIKNKLNELLSRKSEINNELIHVNNDISKVNNQISKINEVKEQAQEIESKLKHKTVDYRSNDIKLQATIDTLRIAFNKLNVRFRDDVEIKAYGDKIQGDTNNIDKELQTINNLIFKLESYQKQYNEITYEKNSLKSLVEKIEQKIDIILSNYSLDQMQSSILKNQEIIINYNERRKNTQSNLKTVELNHERLTKEIATIKNRSKQYKNQVFTNFNIDYINLPDIKPLLQKQKKKINIDEENKSKLIKSLSIQIGADSGEIELSNKTIAILNDITEISKCPTCFKPFLSTDREKLIEEHNSKKMEIEAKKKKRIHKINNIELELKNIGIEKQKIFSKLDLIDQLIYRIPEMQINEEELIAKLDELNSNSELIYIYRENQAELNKIDILSLKKEIESFNDNIVSYDELKALRNKNLAKIETLNKQLEKLSQEIDNNSIKNVLDQKISLKSKKNEYNRKLIILRDEIIPNFTLRDELIKIEIQLGAEIITLKGNKADLKLYDKDEHTSLLLSLEKLIEHKGKIISEFEIVNNTLIPQLKDNLNKSIKDARKLKSIQTELKKIEITLSKSSTINSILGIIPNSIMSKITDVVSYQITQTLRRLLPGRGFDNVEFQDNGDINLFHKGKQIDRKIISGGEKTVLGVAMRLALAEYVAPLKFIILDEPTIHLDQKRIEEFIEIVDRDDLFTDRNGQLIIVTHKDEFNRNAAKTIKITIDDKLNRNISVNE